jgi:hypothetical protein
MDIAHFETWASWHVMRRLKREGQCRCVHLKMLCPEWRNVALLYAGIYQLETSIAPAGAFTAIKKGEERQLVQLRLYTTG